MISLVGCEANNATVSTNNVTTQTTTEIPDYSKFVTLGDYKNIEYDMPEEYIYTQADLNEAFEQEKNETFSTLTAEKVITDRGAQDMDNVHITYTGTIDGKPFDGSDSPEDGEDIVLGYSGYPADFEAGIVGMKTGETKEIKVEIPISNLTSAENTDETSADKKTTANASDETKTAIYTVTVDKIFVYGLPETITDEDVQECTKYETYAEYEEQTMKYLEESYADQLINYRMNLIIEELINRSEFTSIPQGMIDELVNSSTATVVASAKESNMTTDDYLNTYFGMESLEAYQRYMAERAEEYLKVKMVVCEVARKENVQITETDMNVYKDEIRTYYGLDDDADVSSYESDDDILFECIVDAVQSILLTNSKENIVSSELDSAE